MIPLLFVAVAIACGVLWIFGRSGRLIVDVGGQGSPQQVYFGTEYRALVDLPGIDAARVWEPEPATVYFRERQ